MLKLLTEEERGKVSREYHLRRAAVIVVALVSILVIGIIGLLPSYILSNTRHKEALEWDRVVDNSSLKEDEKALQAWLTETNRRLTTLSPKLDVDRPSNFVKKVLEQKISGISITHFSWGKVAGKVVLSVSGEASNRQALVAFKDRLSASGYFSDVALPVSDLAKDKEISFQIKFLPI